MARWVRQCMADGFGGSKIRIGRDAGPGWGGCVKEEGNGSGKIDLRAGAGEGRAETRAQQCQILDIHALRYCLQQRLVSIHTQTPRRMSNHSWLIAGTIIPAPLVVTQLKFAPYPTHAVSFCMKLWDDSAVSACMLLFSVYNLNTGLPLPLHVPSETLFQTLPPPPPPTPSSPPP